MVQQTNAKLDWPYIATSTLLVAHEIDGAVWQEWTLFPWAGGSQAFVLENIVLPKGEHGAVRPTRIASAPEYRWQRRSLRCLGRRRGGLASPAGEREGGFATRELP